MSGEGYAEVWVGSGWRGRVFRVRVRDPRVTLSIDAGSASAYPGERVKVPIVVSYREGDLDRAQVEVYVGGERLGLYSIPRGGSVVVEAELGPGEYRVSAVESTTGRGVHGVVRVERRRPSIRLVGVEGLALYPEGGEVAVRVALEPASSSVAKVGVVEAKGGSVRVAGVAGDSVRLRVEPGPSRAVEARLAVTVRSVDGVMDDLGLDVEVPVRLSEPARREWRRRIERVLRGVEAKPLVEWLGEAEQLLKECLDTVGRLGFDCGELKRAVESVRRELRGLDEAVVRIAQLISRGGLEEAAQLVLEASEACGKGRYRGYQACGELERLAVKLVEQAASSMEELYRESRYDEILGLGESVLKVCSLNVKGAGRGCGVVERYVNLARSIEALLAEGIELSVPESHVSRIIRGAIRVSYKGGGEPVDGVRIDFTPASGYIRVEPRQVELPRLIPGSDFEVEVVMESLVRGRVPIPYKVCHNKYCIEKTVYTAVGIPGAAPARARSLEDYAGKAVHRLRKLKLEPPRLIKLATLLKLPPYTCTAILGQGGYATALLCHDDDGVNAVLKVPHEALQAIQGDAQPSPGSLGSEEVYVEAFDREARILSKLSHPNIIRVLGHGVKRVPYIAFEFCEYGDLGRIAAKQGGIDVKTALEVMIQVGAALDYGHRHKVMHLDVKPSNILVTKELIPKLSDYNIAKTMALVSRSSRSKVESGEAFTPGFGAPEQANPALATPGAYSDVFSHAATLYYLITGNYPYPLEEWRVRRFRGNPEPTPPSRYKPDLPRELDMILVEALASNPLARPQSMREYVESLIEVYERL